MFYLLFIFYLILLCIAINHIGFIKNAGIDKKSILILFLIKVAAGLCMGWIVLRFFDGGDYGAANMHGLLEYNVLIKDPYKFFTEFLNADYSHGYGGMFDSVHSFWHDLAGTCLYKLLGLFNIFSRGNFYINTLFLNFIGFFGHIALFRVFNHVYKNKKWPLVLGCFLIPSTLYFSSGLHKDNLIFTFVCIFSYALYLTITKFSIRKILLLVVAAAVLFLIRNYVLVALIPAAFAMWLAVKTGKHWQSFGGVYALALLITIVAIQFAPSKDPLQIITQKQQDFFKLETATTQVYMDTLQPTLGSFAKNLPQALEHGFLRPYVWEKSSPYLFIPGLELLAYLLITTLAIFLYFKSPSPPPAFVLYGLCFSITILIFIGFVVPNLGSIIRYRSLYLPFFLIPALCVLHTYIKK